MKKIPKKLKISIVVVLVAACTATVFSFKLSAPENVQYLQISTIESIIPGGLGRSKMLIVYPDGKNETFDMKNLYSLVGINFGNITENMQNTMTKLNGFTSQGWTLVSITANSQSPSDKNNDGIFMTRYLLQKTQ